MTQHYNSAYRLRAIVEHALSGNPDLPAWQVWAHVFGIKTDTSLTVATQYEVSKALSLVRGEITLLRSSLEHTFLDKSDYEEEINQLYAMTKLELLFQGWRSTAQNVDRSIIKLLGYQMKLISPDSKMLDAEEIEKLTTLVLNLRNEITLTSLPEDIKRYLIRQVAILSNAIRFYNITGVRAFYDALGEVVATNLNSKKAHQEAVEDEQAQQILHKIQIAYNNVMARAGELSILVDMADFTSRLLGG